MLLVSWNASRWGTDVTGLDLRWVPFFYLILEAMLAGLSEHYFVKWVHWSCLSSLLIWSLVIQGNWAVGTGRNSPSLEFGEETDDSQVVWTIWRSPIWSVSLQSAPLTSTLDYSASAQENMKDMWLLGASNTVGVTNRFGQAHPLTPTLWSFPIYAKD